MFTGKGYLIYDLSFIISILISVAAFSAAAATYIRGDANGNGSVTIDDVTTIQRVLAQLDTDSKGAIARRGNVTDSTLDISDATSIQRFLAGIDDNYGIGKTVYYDQYELPFIPN